MSARLSDFGIELTLPAGWYGQIFRDTDSVMDTGPLVHFANSPLILGDRNGYAGPTRQTMRPGDAIVCAWNMPSLPHLLALGGERVGPTRGWSLAGADDATFEGVGDGRSSLRKAIIVGERLFDLVAFFGADPPPPALVGEVDGILATVRIDVSQGRAATGSSSTSAPATPSASRRTCAARCSRPTPPTCRRVSWRPTGAAFPDGV